MPTMTTLPASPPSLPSPERVDRTPSRQGARDRASQRRVRIADYIMRGWTQQQMAEAESISPAQVHYDIRALRDEWYQAHIEQVNEAVAADLARLSAGVVALWPRVLSGDPRAMDSVTKAIELRLKAQGVLQAGVKVDVTAFVQEIAVKYGFDGEYATRVADSIMAGVR